MTMAPLVPDDRVDVYIEDELRSSFLDYAMSVIVSRALPDARDGLKPVHRRILHGMNELGLAASRPYRKSARVVGEVLGKFHPHGEGSVYDAVVRLAQDFSMRYPLVDGQGNFGSIDGDSAAAMRYTEARLSRAAEQMLADIDKNTVDFQANFDESQMEPIVLPTRLPNLLVNGSSGIAVGMATNIPPHNLGEVLDALIALIDNPAVTTRELMGHVKGPDFPTGGIIVGRSGILQAYETGRGRIIVRGRTDIETDDQGREAIIITEIPYMVNKTKLIEKMVSLVQEKVIPGIRDIRDESDRSGMRLVIEIKRDAVAQVIVNQLLHHTPLQSTFGANMLAIVNGRPQMLTLKEMLIHFMNHRREVVRRRSQFDLEKAEAREHIVAGLLKALDHIDEVIELIRSSADVETAREGLMTRFELSELQARAILEMRLSRLTGLERSKLEHELAELQTTIGRLREILGSEHELLGVIRDEILELRGIFADERRTQFIEEELDIAFEDLIAERDMVVLVTHEGYAKRMDLGEFNAQRRGGQGVRGITAKEADYVEHLYVASTHDYLLIFTNRGRVHSLKVYQIPESNRTSRGKPLVNLLSHLEAGEKVQAVLPARTFEDPNEYILMATKRGWVKKTPLSAYRPRSISIVAILLQDEDELIGVTVLRPAQDVLLATSEGKAIRFSEEDVRVTGRKSMGVRGIRVEGSNRVVGMSVLDPGDETRFTVLTVTERGYGKRTPIEAYPQQGRGGKGRININVSKKIGPAVSAALVQEDQELMIITSQGKIIRLNVNEIRVIGRNTQGVKLQDLKPGEVIAAVTSFVSEGEGTPVEGIVGKVEDIDIDETEELEDIDETDEVEDIGETEELDDTDEE
jgi:DNA gyrase subunit A